MIPNNTEYDVWSMIFEQTPVLLRFVLGVLTLGVFTLAGMLWRWNRADLKRVEEQMHTRMDRMEGQINTQFSELRSRLDGWDRPKQ